VNDVLFDRFWTGVRLPPLPPLLNTTYSVMEKEIKIIGLQRSGTNYLSTLLENNYKVDSIDTGQKRKGNEPRKYFWKHSYDPEQYEEGTNNSPASVSTGIKNLKSSNIPTILITKNPYFWLESVKRGPGDIGKSGISFVKWARIKTTSGKPTVKLGPYGHHDLENVCKMWVDYHRFWIENNFSSLHVLRYEDLLKSPETEIQQIENMFNLERRNKDLDIPKKVHMSKNFDPKRIQRSIEQKYPDISEQEKKIMTSVLQKEVLDFYKYRLLEN
jgi:hypothetical protein